ncbi:MAG TPA: hypothetical protein VFT22_45450 [Kofleriaceae bacterium]|nr:hypothetical protein [Kofleriaceae bacterium]
MLATMIAMTAAVLTGCASEGSTLDRQRGSCVIGGCSDEVCADQPSVSPCIWREQNQCYHAATCGPQADGRCGWDMTPALTACLAEHSK